MRNYLREHSTGSILGSTFEIYGKHFLKVFMIYFVPTFPAMVFQREALGAGSVALAVVAFVFLILVAGLAYAATTIALSDICLGNKPSFVRAYAKVLGPLVGKLLLTNLLTSLLLLVGAFLLILPALLFGVWFMFASPVVVLEGKWGGAALKRSLALGKGFFLRNLAVVIVLMLVSYLAGGLVGLLFGLLVPESVGSFWFRTVIAALQAAVALPISTISFVLMYYDMRVRKEAYDSVALAQELRH